ncbi:SDR family oxidoreductase [Umezawaea sp. Da 62-37]|uniref:SDR family NAD(P)-dependent oxidoreductase n=1 Tax=Umezawaea sp. Da 62-37 TaxID=3075927 RepID=UPI0028F7050E|nr:SDR family oxidoreductase [Umezawaea sp. Da 62-37]WNV85345.1 SDR family oxidoreductase [Umezawaea sp. Da 62-37]
MTETFTDQQVLTPLLGKTALVTGGGRGIGAAVSRRLARAGARVVVVGRDAEVLKRLVDELPHDAVAITADLSAPEAPGRVLGQAIAAVGRLDILVNNAGTGHVGASDEASTAEVDAILNLNVRAAVVLQGRAAEHMASFGGGAVVALSSALAGLGNSGTALAAASKGALDSYGRALAAEWGGRGVRVNVVRPAVTRSDMSAVIVDDEKLLAHYVEQVPLGRVGEAEEIAEAVLFLTSPQSSYLTGQVIDVDGGWTTTKPSIVGAVA